MDDEYEQDLLGKPQLNLRGFLDSDYDDASDSFMTPASPSSGFGSSGSAASFMSPALSKPRYKQCTHMHSVHICKVNHQFTLANNVGMNIMLKEDQEDYPMKHIKVAANME